MLLYINNSASSPTDRGHTRPPEEPEEQEPFRFLFSGLGVANDRDDVSGLVIPNPFLAFARDLDQVIWNAGEGIALADIPERLTQAHKMDMVAKSLRETLGSAMPPTSDGEVPPSPTPPKVAEASADVEPPSGRRFPAARCRRTTSPPVRHARMRQSSTDLPDGGHHGRRISRHPKAAGVRRKRGWCDDSS